MSSNTVTTTCTNTNYSASAGTTSDTTDDCNKVGFGCKNPATGSANQKCECQTDAGF